MTGFTPQIEAAAPAGMLIAQRRARWKRRLMLGLLGMFVLLLLAPGLAAAEVSKEYRIKAAFLYNFTKFVEWPAERFHSDDSPILIGVIGANPFGDVLEETVKDRTVNGRPVQVVQLKDGRDLAAVHVVFAARSEGPCEVVFGGGGAWGVLTVSECEENEAGLAAINFRTVGDKVRFEINIAEAEARGLKLSAHLQKLATVVKR